MAVRFKNFTKPSFIRTKKQLAREMMKVGLMIEREAKESMGGGGLPHRPSSPGEPPHVDTGRLRSSITTAQTIGTVIIIVRVGTNVRYGLYLELGTRHIQSRPWLRPAFMRIAGQLN